MHRSRALTRLVLLLTLLVLQAQVLASAALGCRHLTESEDDAGAVAVCPMHGQMAQQGAPEPEPLLDCQKCVLHFAVAVHPLAAAAPVLPGAGSPGEPAGLPERHYYRFIPDSLLNPPIG